MFFQRGRSAGADAARRRNFWRSSWSRARRGRRWRRFDPYSCNLRLQAISAGTQAELATVFRLVPDQVRIMEIPPDVVPRPTRDAVAHGDASGWSRRHRRAKTSSPRGQGGENHAGRFGAAARVAANALRQAGMANGRSGSSAPEQQAVSQSNSRRFYPPSTKRCRRSPKDDPDELSAPASEAPARAASRLLRVDESKIDALLDLAGELLVVKNGFAHLAKRVEGELGGHDLARAIRGQHDAIERLASELHAAVLQLRMVPVAQVFRSFPRLVRDMSQRLE